MRQLHRTALILLLNATCACALGAQEVYFGALAGPSFTDIDWIPRPESGVRSRTALSAGVFAGLELNSVSFEARALWVRNTADLDVTRCCCKEAILVARLDYLSIPLLARWGLTGRRIRPFLLAGPEVGFKTGASLVEETAERRMNDPDFDQSTPSHNFSFDIGGGVEIDVGRSSLIFEALYAHGLRYLTVETNPNAKGLRTRSLRVHTGLRF